MMKRIIPFLLASALIMELIAVPLPRPRPRIPRRMPRHARPNPVGKAISNIPWQTVLAGGAAASGIVFAYKVSDGIQKGTVEAAKKAPENFMDRCTGISGTMQVLCAVCVLIAIAYLVWRLGYRNRKPPDNNADEDRPSS